MFVRKLDLSFMLKKKNLESSWVNGRLCDAHFNSIIVPLMAEMLQVNGFNFSINGLSVLLSSVKKKKSTNKYFKIFLKV